MPKKAVREICRKALCEMLVPIVRFALARSLKQRDVLEYLKLAFMQVAKEELERLGKTHTASKLSVMTGIQRREAARLLKESPAIKRDQDVMARVVGLWQGGSEYLDEHGKPKVLELKSRSGAFADLVSNVSTDLNPYTIQFELERMGVVEVNDQKLRLVRPGYEPSGNLEEGLRLLSGDAKDLYHSVNENLFKKPTTPNLHIKTEYDNIPVSKEKEIRDWFLVKGAEFHEEARKFLSALDRDVQPEIAEEFSKEQSVRVAIGTFSFTKRSQQ